MIHELLGGASLIAGERKISINNNGVAGVGVGVGGGVLLPPTPSSTTSSHSPPNSTTATTTVVTTNGGASENQNLRCPRCDSANTKFCYYNNYNLTQPRHFCKTCRRYWTKGGALRNVPIGGGCRKSKNVAVSNSATKAAATTKLKAVASSSSGLCSGFAHHELLPTTPILWGSPQNTHLLALLKATHHGQNQNPNPNPSSVSFNDAVVKEEGSFIMGSHQNNNNTHLMTEPLITNLNPRVALVGGFDGVIGQANNTTTTSLGSCSTFWRNNNQNQLQQHNNSNNNININSGFVLGEHQNMSGIQELYHKLRSSSSSSSANYSNDISPSSSSSMFMGNMGSSSSFSNIYESPSSVAGGELGSWNPTLAWSDLPTTNGAYP